VWACCFTVYTSITLFWLGEAPTSHDTTLLVCALQLSIASTLNPKPYTLHPKTSFARVPNALIQCPRPQNRHANPNATRNARKRCNSTLTFRRCMQKWCHNSFCFCSITTLHRTDSKEKQARSRTLFTIRKVYARIFSPSIPSAYQESTRVVRAHCDCHSRPVQVQEGKVLLQAHTTFQQAHLQSHTTFQHALAHPIQTTHGREVHLGQGLGVPV